jgi:hypothetical protein
MSWLFVIVKKSGTCLRLIEAKKQQVLNKKLYKKGGKIQ